MCTCAPIDLPVCGADGITYANRCVYCANHPVTRQVALEIVLWLAAQTQAWLHERHPRTVRVPCVRCEAGCACMDIVSGGGC